MVNPTPWFKIDDDGIQFYDVEECDNDRGMVAAHFRHSTTKKKVDLAKAQWKNAPTSITQRLGKWACVHRVKVKVECTN